MSLETLLNSCNFEFHIYRKLIKNHTAKLIFKDLRQYLKQTRRNKTNGYPFVATFPNEIASSEKEFQNNVCKYIVSVYSKHIKISAEEKSDKQQELYLNGTRMHLIFMHPKSKNPANVAPLPSIVIRPYSGWPTQKPERIKSKHLR